MKQKFIKQIDKNLDIQRDTRDNRNRYVPSPQVVRRASRCTRRWLHPAPPWETMEVVPFPVLNFNVTTAGASANTGFAMEIMTAATTATKEIAT